MHATFMLQLASLWLVHLIYGLRIAITDSRTFRIPNTLVTKLALTHIPIIGLSILFHTLTLTEIGGIAINALCWFITTTIMCQVSRGGFGMGDVKYISVIALGAGIFHTSVIIIVWLAALGAVIVWLARQLPGFRKTYTFSRHPGHHIAFGPYLTFSSLACFAFALMGQIVKQ